MNKERELLGKWYIGDLLPEEYMKLMKETKELLAQPEGITPREGLTEYKRGYAKAELDLREELREENSKLREELREEISLREAWLCRVC